MTWEAADTPGLTLSAMSQASYVKATGLTPQGIEQRFTPEAAEFMRQMMALAVSQVIEERMPATMALLDRFSAVYLLDSSVIGLVGTLQERYPGVGGTAGAAAAVKLQVRLELRTGALDGSALQPGRAHDRTTPFTSADEPVGSLRICDLAYFSLDEIAGRRAAGQYTLTRYKKGTALYTGDGQRLPMRLVAQRVPPKAVACRRRRLQEYARKKQVTVNPETWALAAWTLVLVDVPQGRLSLEEALVLLRARWQVELLFKRWKSLLRVDECRSGNPYRVLCELYGKLMVAVMEHWIFRACCWDDPGRSLAQATRLVQKVALSLGCALHQRTGVEALLRQMADCIRATCHLNKRRTRPATLQTLCTAAGAST